MKNPNKKRMDDLVLKTETVSHLSDHQMRNVKGGFLSIGHACSHRIKCDRLWTKCWGDSNGDSPGGTCEHDDILNA